jgi:hypothetical protein
MMRTATELYMRKEEKNITVSNPAFVLIVFYPD